jgi:proline dehydrogenase
LLNENGILKGLIFKLVRKHIAGATADSAIRTALKFNENKIHTTITFLNENPKDAVRARYNTNAYLQLLRQVSRLHAYSDISLRPSQLGYGTAGSSSDSISEIIKLAEQEKIITWLEGQNSTELEYAVSIAESHPSKYLGIELPIPEIMKGGMYEKLKKQKLHLKISTYAYENAKRESEERTRRFRHEGHKHAAKSESESDHKWVDLLCRISAGSALRLSSSDDKLAYKIMKRIKPDKGRLTLEVLLGYSPKRIRKLVKDNINVSIYIPYGRDWVPYAISRLTEGHIRDIAVAILDGEQKGSGEDG